MLLLGRGDSLLPSLGNLVSHQAMGQIIQKIMPRTSLGNMAYSLIYINLEWMILHNHMTSLCGRSQYFEVSMTVEGGAILVAAFLTSFVI